MRVSEILRQQADLLESGEFAWVNRCPGSVIRRDTSGYGPFGSRKEACLVYRYDPDALPSFQSIGEVDSVLGEVLHEREEWNGGIISWQDAQTSVEPVIELLRAAADRAEALDQ